jgi:phosphoglycolate phosphatase-like HAD superfamily hydrolase
MSIEKNPQFSGTYIKNSQIEIINNSFQRGKIKYAFFDYDGTISTVRQGWDIIMKNIMVKAIMGDQAASIPDDKKNEIESSVADYIDRTAGVQMILQMKELRQMIVDYNFVSEEKIFSAKEYKNLAYSELGEIVRERLSNFRRGNLNSEDLTIKGAVTFLKDLREKGVSLHLVSGGDQNAIRHNSKILGYADLFEGRINGSIESSNENSKENIMKRVIMENNLEGAEIVCFGDGPEEIRVAVKYGAIAIGVASDEITRSGLNPEKRKRLIESGANIIIPDFSDSDKILDYLFPIQEENKANILCDF